MSSQKITIDYQEYLDLLQSSRNEIQIYLESNWNLRKHAWRYPFDKDERSAILVLKEQVESSSIKINEQEQTIKNLQNECKELRSEHEKEINRILGMSVWQFIKWRSI